MKSFSRHFDKRVLQITGASSIRKIEVIQDLWSGYGRIARVFLCGAIRNSVVVKQIQIEKAGGAHPRGWNSERSHLRKIRSYEVETEWYRNWGGSCEDGCRIPQCLLIEETDGDLFVVLEDLGDSGFPLVRMQASENDVELCLRWLANFHATFFNKEPEGLWEVGTYWHLGTRPDELNEMREDDPLKMAAGLIDEELNSATFKTIVHGDAKLANFCFSKTDEAAVAAVDFQYVGGGCGMKDVAYFLGSCLDENTCEAMADAHLDLYFAELEKSLDKKHPQIDIGEVILEWKSLYPLAWTDFHRFLKGWCPGHWKINQYSEKIAAQVVEGLC